MKTADKNTVQLPGNKNNINATIAATRFAMGLRPGDLELAQKDSEHWLLNQLKPMSLHSSLVDLNADQPELFPSSVDALKKNVQYRAARVFIRKLETDHSLSNIPKSKNTSTYKKEYSKAQKKVDSLRPQSLLRKYVEQSIHIAMTTEQSFTWRLFDFFSNHFSVTANGSKMSFLAPTLELEAIAPNILGSFENLLIAVESHPAMLVYLNNENSKGPNSTSALKNKKRGLNENLAREILELHTLGVNGGYKQDDVIELAKAISGWSVLNRKETQRLLTLEKETIDSDKKDKKLLASNGFRFRNSSHEPGSRMILNKKYFSQGHQQGIDILKDLASHPKTIEHISRKIAQHFVSGTPSEELVSHLMKSWRESKGNLKIIMEALIRHPESWKQSQLKFKTPREYFISVGRACQKNDFLAPRAFNALTQLGQKPFGSGSPAGYPDEKNAWSGSTALDAKIEAVAQLSKRLKISALDLAISSSGSQLTEQTKQAILRAESQSQGRSLALLSPEFLHR